MPKGSFRVRSGTVDVHFLEPVETTGLDYERRHRADARRLGRAWRARCATEYGVGTSEHPIAESSGEQIA